MLLLKNVFPLPIHTFVPITNPAFIKQSRKFYCSLPCIIFIPIRHSIHLVLLHHSLNSCNKA